MTKRDGCGHVPHIRVDKILRGRGVCEINIMFYKVFLLLPHVNDVVTRASTLRSDLRSCRFRECLFRTVFEHEDQGEVIISD